MPSSRGVVHSAPPTCRRAACKLLFLAQREPCLAGAGAQPSQRSRLVASEDGAIIAFGVFFGVLLLGLLYYMVGLGATMYYRERLQDAADASAFAAAVVHARGMNTLALINVVMAALLSVLVALRLVQALITIAEVILYALSWLGGATAAIASALEVVRQVVVDLADAASPIILNVNKVLKVGGEAIRIATPLASNVSVIAKVANHYTPEVKIAVAIPARFTLPAEDDDFPYLCKKAGTISAALALLPIKPIIPGGLRKKLEGAIGSLIGAGSTWFCDGSAPPTYETEPKVNDLPASEKVAACTDRDKGGENAIGLCRDAEEEQGRGEPDKETGLCRVGQDVCQPMVDKEGYADEVDPDGERQMPGQVVPYSSHSWCGSEGEGAKVTVENCHELEKDGRKYPDVATPYGARLAKARADCDPKYGDRYDYWWMERELDVTWEWNAALSLWVEQEATEAVKPTAIGRPPADRIPCQGITVTAYSDYQEPTQVTTSATWNARPALDEPVCVLDAPKPSAPMAPSDPTRVTLRRTEVLQVLGCSSKDAQGTPVVVEAINLGASELKKEGVEQLQASPEEVGHEYNVSMDDLGMEDTESAGGSESGSEDTVPFRFIKGHRLGTSDMQVRAVALGTKLSDTDLEDETPTTGSPEQIKAQIDAEAKARESVHRQALRVIGITRWGRGSDSNTLSKASEIWGRFSVAQAEYYFDVSADEDTLATWAGWDNDEASDGGRDFLWAMYWTARMRRFRFSYEVDGENADGPSEADSESSGGAEGMAQKLGIELPSIDQTSDQIASDGPTSACEQIDQLKDICGQLGALDGVFIH